MLMMKDQVQIMDKVLDNIQDRDAKVHRVLFGMDPIDRDLWKAVWVVMIPMRDYKA